MCSISRERNAPAPNISEARHNLGWTPLHLVCSVASGVEPVLKPAGLENAEGLISTAYSKDPFDPNWADDADVKTFLEWAKQI